MVQRIEQIRSDRLRRWSVYASIPFIWLALALLNPFVLLVPPMITFAIWKAMEYGMIERNDPPEDPDFYRMRAALVAQNGYAASTLQTTSE